VVAEGTPEEVAAESSSYTGQILKESLFSSNGRRPAPGDGQPTVAAIDGKTAENSPTPIST
jgi:hypothetical protein